jgi:hypothetical protein
MPRPPPGRKEKRSALPLANKQGTSPTIPDNYIPVMHTKKGFFMYLKPISKEIIAEAMPNLPGAEEESLNITACQYLFDNEMWNTSWRFDETAHDSFVEGELPLLEERLAFFLAQKNGSPAEKEELLIQKIREMRGADRGHGLQSGTDRKASLPHF